MTTSTILHRYGPWIHESSQKLYLDRPQVPSYLGIASSPKLQNFGSIYRRPEEGFPTSDPCRAIRLTGRALARWPQAQLGTCPEKIDRPTGHWAPP